MRQELEHIYGECAQQLFTCAVVLTGDPQRAEDAVHDAFCRLLRKRRWFRPRNMKAYVFRCVRNAAVDVVRADSRLNSALNDLERLPLFEEVRTAPEAVDAGLLKTQVAAALTALPPDERETVVQHLWGNLTFREIAIVRDRPIGTVASWYRRGLEKLSRLLEESR